MVGGATSSVRIATPPLAGLVVAVLGPGAAFGLQAIVLAIAVVLLLSAHVPSQKTAPAIRFV
jgi:hypothetical protein